MTKASDWVVKPALCLDLDGTVRYNRNDPQGFVNGPEDVAIFEGTEEKLWQWRAKGYLVFGVSNQGGVAFGYKTQETLDAEYAAMINAFANNPFHFVKFCMHHEKGVVEPYSHRSLLRKPDIGMLALMEFECFHYGYVVDWDKSLFVGDRPEDEECARRAGIGFRHADEFFKRTP